MSKSVADIQFRSLGDSDCLDKDDFGERKALSRIKFESGSNAKCRFAKFRWQNLLMSKLSIRCEGNDVSVSIAGAPDRGRPEFGPSSGP
jgi:hypothetical protein